MSERQRSARTRSSHAELANLGLPPQDCTVGTALAFCGYASNEVDRDASILSCSGRKTTCSYTRTHMHIHTHTCTSAHTHTGAHTHRQMHMRTRVHAHIHTHTHTRAHTHTHTLAIAPKLAHACSSSSSDSNNSKSTVDSISSLSLWEVKVATHKPPGLQKPR